MLFRSRGYIADYNPDVIQFGSNNDYPSRTSLYDRAMQNASKYFPGYTLDITYQEEWEKEYRLVKTKQLTEGLAHPCIVVDVQPTYAYYDGGHANEDICKDIINFVNGQTGPVLMYVNADDTGMTEESIPEIMQYWEDTVLGPDYDYDTDDNVSPINWNRFEIIDKGYGYLRSWLDNGISDRLIIKTIRLMYQQKVSDSRELFDGEDSETYEQSMINWAGAKYQPWML